MYNVMFPFLFNFSIQMVMVLIHRCMLIFCNNHAGIYCTPLFFVGVASDMLDGLDDLHNSLKSKRELYEGYKPLKNDWTLMSEAYV